MSEHVDSRLPKKPVIDKDCRNANRTLLLAARRTCNLSGSNLTIVFRWCRLPQPKTICALSVFI